MKSYISSQNSVEQRFTKALPWLGCKTLAFSARRCSFDSDQDISDSPEEAHVTSGTLFSALASMPCLLTDM